jgi:hypothetical protein
VACVAATARCSAPAAEGSRGAGVRQRRRKEGGRPGACLENQKLQGLLSKTKFSTNLKI